MKRRLSLLIALLGSPKLLFLDEPSSGCDSYTRELIRKLILQLKYDSNIALRKSTSSNNYKKKRQVFNDDAYSDLYHDQDFRDLDEMITPCAVMLSTHHLDDIEILGDQVLFLNDTSLMYDGSYSHLLHSVVGPPQLPFLNSSNDDRNFHNEESFVFSTSDAKIHHLFTLKLTMRVNCENSEIKPFSEDIRIAHYLTSNSTLYKWILTFPTRKLDEWIEFIRYLETQNLLNWSISSPSFSDCLKNMYSINLSNVNDYALASDPTSNLDICNMREGEPNEIDQLCEFNGISATQNISKECDQSKYVCHSYFVKVTDHAYFFFHQFAAIFSFRYLELKSNLAEYLISNLLIPCVITLVICYVCRDVRYPKIELSSQLTDGVGEVVIGFGDKSAESMYPTSIFMDESIHHPNNNFQGLPYNAKAFKIYPPQTQKALIMPNDAFNTTVSRQALSSITPTVKKKSGNDSNASFKLNSTLFSNLNSTKEQYCRSFLSSALDKTYLTWKSAVTSSNLLWTMLFNEYYLHKTKDRWSAFVIQDSIDNWIESSIILDDKSFPKDVKVNISQVYLDILSAHDEICNRTMGIDTQLNPQQRKRMIRESIESTIYICSQSRPIVAISLMNASIPHNDSISEADNLATEQSQFYIRIHAFESLFSNVTMLSNVTASHSTPVFLKEVMPLVYASLLTYPPDNSNITSLMQNSLNTSDVFDAVLMNISGVEDRSGSLKLKSRYLPHYRLYSYPLPMSSLSNDVYIERGYIGSTLILLYILIISSLKSARVITYLRLHNIKTLFHMKGLQLLVYWFSNVVFDILLSFLTFLAILLALVLGGNPVCSYFTDFKIFIINVFSNKPIFSLNNNMISQIYSSSSISSKLYDSLIGSSNEVVSPALLYLIIAVIFSSANVTSSYLFVCLSTDQLSSQLMILLSTILNGIFLKLYVDRHRGMFPYNVISIFMLHVSPAFTLATCFFEMFKLHASELALVVSVSPSVTNSTLADMESKHTSKKSAAELLYAQIGLLGDEFGFSYSSLPPYSETLALNRTVFSDPKYPRTAINSKESSILSRDIQLSQQIISSCLLYLLIQSVAFFILIILVDKFSFFIYSKYCKTKHFIRMYVKTFQLLNPWRECSRDILQAPYSRSLDESINYSNLACEESLKCLHSDGQLTVRPTVHVGNHFNRYADNVKTAHSSERKNMFSWFKPKSGARISKNMATDIPKALILSIQENKLTRVGNRVKTMLSKFSGDIELQPMTKKDLDLDQQKSEDFDTSTDLDISPLPISSSYNRQTIELEDINVLSRDLGESSTFNETCSDLTGYSSRQLNNTQHGETIDCCESRGLLRHFHQFQQHEYLKSQVGLFPLNIGCSDEINQDNRTESLENSYKYWNDLESSSDTHLSCSLRSKMSFYSEESSDMNMFYPYNTSSFDAMKENENCILDIDRMYVQFPNFRGNPPDSAITSKLNEFRKNQSFALKKLKCNIGQNDRVAVMGVSGGGKSSLFKTLALCAEYIPLAGKVTYTIDT